MTNPPLVRPYRGTTAEKRIAQRRTALLDGALKVFEADGWSGVSARRVCDEAGLTRRYFYESFEDVDALMTALLERVTGEVRGAVHAAIATGDAGAAEVARQAISSGLDVLVAVPAKGRLLAAASSAGGTVAAHRAQAIDDLASIVERGFVTQRTKATPSTQQARAAAVGAVGAVLRIIDSWLSGEIDGSREEVVTWSTAAALGVITAVASGP